MTEKTKAEADQQEQEAQQQAEAGASKEQDTEPEDEGQVQPAAEPGEVAAEGQSKAFKPPPTGFLKFLIFLVLLVALAALGLSGYQWQYGSFHQQALQGRVSKLESVIEDDVHDSLQELADQASTLLNSGEQLQDAIGDMESRLSTLETSFVQMAKKVEGGRKTWQMQEIEYLMLVANDRLILAQDISGALQALEIASRRLARISDPDLIAVRREVVDEIASLKAVPNIDITEMVLTLEGWIGQVSRFPLQMDITESYRPAPAGDTGQEMASAGDYWQRFLVSLKRMLKDVVNIRYEQDQVGPLLPPDQEFFLYQNLILKLETARLALLRRDTTTYQDALASAISWMLEFYDTEDPQVVAAIKDLEHIANRNLELALPDITGSLEILRKYMNVSQVTDEQVQPEAAP